jgi:hypothetical protein
MSVLRGPPHNATMRCLVKHETGWQANNPLEQETRRMVAIVSFSRLLSGILVWLRVGRLCLTLSLLCCFCLDRSLYSVTLFFVPLVGNECLWWETSYCLSVEAERSDNRACVFCAGLTRTGHKWSASSWLQAGLHSGGRTTERESHRGQISARSKHVW